MLSSRDEVCIGTKHETLKVHCLIFGEEIQSQKVDNNTNSDIYSFFPQVNQQAVLRGK